MLKQIKERHNHVTGKMCTAQKVTEKEWLLAHIDQDYLLELVEETAMFLKGIKEDLEHMCIKDTCRAEEEIGAFLSKLESEADNDKSQTE